MGFVVAFEFLTAPIKRVAAFLITNAPKSQIFILFFSTKLYSFTQAVAHTPNLIFFVSIPIDQKPLRLYLSLTPNSPESSIVVGCSFKQ